MTKALLVVIAAILLLPVMVLIGFALGPAILVMLFIMLCAVPVLAIERGRLRQR